jgi:hypothetical protein
MSKIAIAGAAALFIAGSHFAYAQQEQEQDRITAADAETLSDARVNIVKSTLQLTPDQQKLWPAVEDAMRARGKDRKTRIQDAKEQAGELRGKNLSEVLSNRNPADFLNRRADDLAQRAADLKKLATAWSPLYQTLTDEQKHRLAHLQMTVLRETRRDLENRRLRSEEEDSD